MIMKWRKFRWWLCVMLSIHTPENETRTGEFISRTKQFGDRLMEVPIRRCCYCGEIIRIGESTK